MESSKSPPGSLRRHGRNVSRPMVRRNTKGPLDAMDDPLAEATKSPSVGSPAQLASPTVSAESSAPQTVPSSSAAQRQPVKVDFRFLQDPAIYHPLPTDGVHPAFLNSDSQPSPDAALPELLEEGHFRLAAGTAVNQLLQCRTNDAEQILRLLYTRLACLVLITHTDAAVQEALPLTEVLARGLSGAKEIVPLVPWELRLLLVRLQSIGAADGGRRGIMALYGLAAEVRARAKEARAGGDRSEQQLWSERLRDIGMRVADALVEMGELETANRHLETLTTANTNEIAYRKALLRVRVGDIAGARHCVKKIEDDPAKAILSALLENADGDFAKASDSWRELMTDQTDALAANNLAVSLLYTGHMPDARKVLEDLAGQAPGFPGMLFNLSTVFELCTERAINLKQSFAQRIAAKSAGPASGGWERTNFDFKL